MWLWLLIQIALVLSPASLAVNSSALAAETSIGPTSTEEAQILSNDGKTAFETGDYARAIILLQRLIDRYPGYSGYLEAHRYLGRSLFFSDQAAQSIAPLRYYISGTGDHELSHLARLWLGDSYLKLGKFHEAFLLALEIERGKSPSPRVLSESQFLKARALISLNQDSRAQKVLDSVQSKPLVQTDPLLRNQAAEVSVQLKMRECGRTPDAKTSSKFNELAFQEAYSRKALCLQEAMTEAKRAFDSAAQNKKADGTSENTEIVSAICDQIIQGFKTYNLAVRNPPAGLHAKSDTPTQREQYRVELVDHLEAGREKTYAEALVTVAGWKNTSTGKFTQIYQNLYNVLEKLSKRES